MIPDTARVPQVRRKQGYTVSSKTRSQRLCTSTETYQVPRHESCRNRICTKSSQEHWNAVAALKEYMRYVNILLGGKRQKASHEQRQVSLRLTLFQGMYGQRPWFKAAHETVLNRTSGGFREGIKTGLVMATLHQTSSGRSVHFIWFSWTPYYL